MNKITINHGTFQVDERVLDHGTISLGRAADNDVQMEDETVSAHHAKIVTVFKASHVEDLGSTNGTFVNGKRVIRHTLHSGDIITAGGYQVVFYTDQGAPKKAPDTTDMLSSTRLEAMIAAADEGIGQEGEAGSNQVIAQPSAGDTVIAMDNDTAMHDEMTGGTAVRNAQHPSGKHRHDHRAELADIEHALHDRTRDDNSRRSLYLTVAVTIAVVIAIVVLVLRV